MTDLMSRIAEDEATYLYNCRRFGENPVYVYNPHAERRVIDIYGDHAKQLAHRAELEGEECYDGI